MEHVLQKLMELCLSWRNQYSNEWKNRIKQLDPPIQIMANNSVWSNKWAASIIGFNMSPHAIFWGIDKVCITIHYSLRMMHDALQIMYEALCKCIIYYSLMSCPSHCLTLYNNMHVLRFPKQTTSNKSDTKTGVLICQV